MAVAAAGRARYHPAPEPSAEERADEALVGALRTAREEWERSAPRWGLDEGCSGTGEPQSGQQSLESTGVSVYLPILTMIVLVVLFVLASFFASTFLVARRPTSTA